MASYEVLSSDFDLRISRARRASSSLPSSVVLLYVNVAAPVGVQPVAAQPPLGKSEGRPGAPGDVICHASAHTREHSSIPPD